MLPDVRYVAFVPGNRPLARALSLASALTYWNRVQTVQTRVRVRYAETDQMGVVYHSNHLIWFEIGRVEYCRAIGIRYRDMEEHDGIFLAVVEVLCRYRHPARYDDELIVETRVASLGTRRIQFDYTLSAAETGRVVAEGYSRHIFCDRRMHPTRLPAKYEHLFRAEPSPPADPASTR